MAATPAPSATPVRLTNARVIGHNAAVALDELHKVQNWTVKPQSAKAGSRLAPDAKLVLGCARIGGMRWL